MCAERQQLTQSTEDAENFRESNAARISEALC